MWRPPLNDNLKINPHGCYHGNFEQVGIQSIGRGKDGEVIFHFSICKGEYSNNLMETLAMNMTIERGSSLGWKRIICESNSQIVVDMMSVVDVNSQLASFVREILYVRNNVD